MFCLCGCGKPTRVPKQSDASKGWIRGVPLRYINGHANGSRLGTKQRRTLFEYRWERERERLNRVLAK